jgi:hypothetical protein
LQIRAQFPLQREGYFLAHPRRGRKAGLFSHAPALITGTKQDRILRRRRAWAIARELLDQLCRHGNILLGNVILSRDTTRCLASMATLPCGHDRTRGKISLSPHSRLLRDIGATDLCRQPQRRTVSAKSLRFCGLMNCRLLAMRCQSRAGALPSKKIENSTHLTGRQVCTNFDCYRMTFFVRAITLSEHCLVSLFLFTRHIFVRGVRPCRGNRLCLGVERGRNSR